MSLSRGAHVSYRGSRFPETLRDARYRGCASWEDDVFARVEAELGLTLVMKDGRRTITVVEVDDSGEDLMIRWLTSDYGLVGWSSTPDGTVSYDEDAWEVL